MENSSLNNRLLDERKRKIEDFSSSSECTFQGSPEQMREIDEIINKTVKTELDKATERITESIKSTFLHRLEDIHCTTQMRVAKYPNKSYN